MNSKELTKSAQQPQISEKTAQETKEMSDALIISMCAPLMNLTKLYLQYPSKNKVQAEKSDLKCAIEMLAQHLLPDFCIRHANDLRVLNQMHNLVFVLNQKARKLFQSSVIAAAINNNRDLEALKRCLYDILTHLKAHKDQTQLKQAIQVFFDEWKGEQINKNDACLQKIYQLLDQSKKEVTEKEVVNLINTFESDFEFIQSDFVNYRTWNYKQDNIEKNRQDFFSKEYSLKAELQSIFNPVCGNDQFIYFQNLFNQVSRNMGSSLDAKVFWLTFFKTDKSCLATQFIDKIQMLCVLNDVYELELIQNAFQGQTNWNQLIDHFDHVINFSLSSDASRIINKFVDLCQHDCNRFGYSILRNQIIFSQRVQSLSSSFVDMDIYKKSKGLQQFCNIPTLKCLSKLEFYHTKDKNDHNNVKVALRYMSLDQPVLDLPKYQLQMKLTRGQDSHSINFTGERSIFTIGNGETFDWNMPFENRFIESQMLLIHKQGKYFVKDCGKLINMVTKLDSQKQIKLFEGAVIDFGRAIKYHCVKCIAPQWAEFGQVDPILEAVHFNHDEKLNKQPKIVFKVDRNMKSQCFTVGRNNGQNKKDLLLSSSSINTHQCTIQYQRDLGWTIHEKEQKPSVKGTFVYVKSYSQFINREPSNSIELSQNQPQQYLIGYSQTTDYLIKFQQKFQSAEMNQFTNSLKNKRQTIANATRLTTPKVKLNTSNQMNQLSIEFDKLEQSFRGTENQNSLQERRNSFILPSQSNQNPISGPNSGNKSDRLPKEVPIQKASGTTTIPDISYKHRFETDDEPTREIEIIQENLDFFDKKSEKKEEQLLPFDPVKSTSQKDPSSQQRVSSPVAIQDLTQKNLQKLPADQESFQGNQSILNVLNQTDIDQQSTGNRSSMSRASVKFSMASFVKSTQFKYTIQNASTNISPSTPKQEVASQISPCPPASTLAQAFKQLPQPQRESYCSDSPSQACPFPSSPTNQSLLLTNKPSTDIIDHRPSPNNQSLNLNLTLTQQYTSVGRDSVSGIQNNYNTAQSSQVNQNWSVAGSQVPVNSMGINAQVANLQKEIDKLRTREALYIADIDKYKTEIDSIKPQFLEAKLENEELKNQVATLKKQLEKTEVQLKQKESYIESKKWEVKKEEVVPPMSDKDSSQLLDLSRDDNKFLNNFSLQFEVPEVDENLETDDNQSQGYPLRLNTIDNSTDLDHCILSTKIQTPQNKKTIDFNQSELTFAGQADQQQIIFSFKGSEHQDFQQEMNNNQFDTPRDQLSENEKPDGQLNRIETISENSQDQNEQSLIQNIQMLEPTELMDKIDISFVLYDPEKQIKVQQIQLDEQNLGRQWIASQSLELKNLVSNLQQLLAQITQFQNKDLVIPLGHSGGGKSTMLTSLVFGPQSLNIKSITRQISKMNSLGTNAVNQTRSITDKVIDIKEDQEINIFKISHEKLRQISLVPSIAEIYIDQLQKTLYFVDIAGMIDASNDMINLVNCFLFKYLTSQAASVKFILPIIQQQMTQGRGMDVRKQINYFEQIYAQPNEQFDLDKFVQPLITKCSTQNDEIDIQDFRYQFLEILEKNSLAQSGQNDQIETEDKHNDNQDQMSSSSDKLMQMFERLADKLQIFDPLDRSIPQNNPDQSIKRKELLNNIINMDSIPSSHLNYTLNDQMEVIFDKMLQNGFKKCNDTLQHHLNKAKQLGDDYKDSFPDDPIVQLYKSHLEFFISHKLSSCCEDRLEKLKEFLKRGKTLVKTAQNFNKYDAIGQQMFEFTEQIYVCKMQKQYEELVQIMIELRKQINELKFMDVADDVDQNMQQIEDYDKKAEQDMHCTRAERFMEDIVTEIANTQEDFVKFAYQLRKQDENDQFSEEFLYGQVHPKILVDIVMQNEWNHQKGAMALKSNCKQFVLHNRKKQILKYTKDGSSKEQAAFVSKENKPNESIAINFLLTTQGGFAIVNSQSQHLCPPSSSNSNPASIQKLSWQPLPLTIPPQTSWQLTPAESNLPAHSLSSLFLIELLPPTATSSSSPKPRLQMVKQLRMAGKVPVGVSSRPSKQYSDPEFVEFKLVYAT